MPATTTLPLRASGDETPVSARHLDATSSPYDEERAYSSNPTALLLRLGTSSA